MIVISSREFRQNQKYYLDLIDNNNQIIVQRGKNKAYKIESIKTEDTIMSKSEYLDKIAASPKQAEEGEIVELTKEKQKELLEI